jgi:hypothetical protein
MKFTVISGPGLSELGHEDGGKSLGARILERAAVDPALAEALQLVGTRTIAWSTVYDIIAFLGGARGVATHGLATKKEADTVRRTANHYRHLGSPHGYALPPQAPALNRASMFAADILKKWIAKRLCARPL